MTYLLQEGVIVAVRVVGTYRRLTAYDLAEFIFRN